MRDAAEPTPDPAAGRVYVHAGCGGETRVSGDDYAHLCDPFRPCMSTYCSGCERFAGLGQVAWADTGEAVAAFRRRVRAETPAVVKVWRYGAGLVVGGAAGAGAGVMLSRVAAPVFGPQVDAGNYALVFGLAGAVGCYFLGAAVLGRVYGVDYRRVR